MKHRRLNRANTTLLNRFALAAILSSMVFLGSACRSPDYLHGLQPVFPDRMLSVVIENPAGTGEKWEVRASGKLIREERDGRPVEIPSLPWPANGGMIPRTLLSKEMGGDGEPLDVLVLGPSIPRGEVVRVRTIGLLHVIDSLERDDKILAVMDGTPFEALEGVEDLESEFPGVREILSGWYSNARPGAAIEVQGYGSRAAANRLIAEGIRSFAEAEAAGRLPEWGSQ